MRTKLKYVMLEAPNGERFPVLFSSRFTHSLVAKGLIQKGMDIDDRHTPLLGVSGGFVEIMHDSDPHIEVVGESTSMNRFPVFGDKELIQNLLGDSYE